jgi:hypothetical protein
MKLFRYLAAGLIAALSVSTAASAKVDPGTTELLQTLNEYGITILYNPSTCGNGFHGQYNIQKVMTLCYSGHRVTAGDFNTVRHETAHVLQHCAAIRRGHQGILPLAINPTERQQWISTVLHSGQISQIKSVYPVHHHQVELEAFAMAEHYTAAELASLVRKWCIK